MATRTLVVTTDDLDGTEDATTRRFALDGREYEIDLSEANAAKLDKAVAEFVAASRRVRPGNVIKTTVNAPARGPAKVDRGQTKAVRAWWKVNGPTLRLPAWTDRGRIPGPVMDAYQTHDGQKVKTAPPPPADMATATGAATAKAVNKKATAKVPAARVPAATFQPAATPTTNGNGKVATKAAKKAAKPKARTEV